MSTVFHDFIKIEFIFQQHFVLEFWYHTKLIKYGCKVLNIIVIVIRTLRRSVNNGFIWNIVRLFKFGNGTGYYRFKWPDKHGKKGTQIKVSYLCMSVTTNKVLLFDMSILKLNHWRFNLNKENVLAITMKKFKKK